MMAANANKPIFRNSSNTNSNFAMASSDMSRGNAFSGTIGRFQTREEHSAAGVNIHPSETPSDLVLNAANTPTDGQRTIGSDIRRTGGLIAAKNELTSLLKDLDSISSTVQPSSGGEKRNPAAIRQLRDELQGSMEMLDTLLRHGQPIPVGRFVPSPSTSDSMYNNNKPDDASSNSNFNNNNSNNNTMNNNANIINNSSHNSRVLVPSTMKAASQPPVINEATAHFVDAVNESNMSPVRPSVMHQIRATHAAAINREVQDWTVSDTTIWLQSVGLEHLREVFVRNDVTGPILIELTDQEMKDDLGITSLGARKQLAKHILKLHARSVKTASDMLRENGTVDMMRSLMEEMSKCNSLMQQLVEMKYNPPAQVMLPIMDSRPVRAPSPPRITSKIEQQQQHLLTSFVSPSPGPPPSLTSNANSSQFVPFHSETSRSRDPPRPAVGSTLFGAIHKNQGISEAMMPHSTSKANSAFLSIPNRPSSLSSLSEQQKVHFSNASVAEGNNDMTYYSSPSRSMGRITPLTQQDLEDSRSRTPRIDPEKFRSEGISPRLSREPSPTRKKAINILNEWRSKSPGGGRTSPSVLEDPERRRALVDNWRRSRANKSKE